MQPWCKRIQVPLKSVGDVLTCAGIELVPDLFKESQAMFLTLLWTGLHYCGKSAYVTLLQLHEQHNWSRSTLG